MYKLRSYISTLMLALLLFPAVEKLRHELKHLDEDHCDTIGLHYCASEHSCSICDYIFSSAGAPPNEQNHIDVIFKETDYLANILVSDYTPSKKYTFSLRGPPAC